MSKGKRTAAGLALGLGALLLTACTTAPQSAEDRKVLDQDVVGTIQEFQAQDQGLKSFFDSAAGYAVFPDVGRGAAGVGGAYGHGEVYEKGARVGYCDLSQATIGLQLGGQTFREVIFFESRDALERFKTGQMAFTAEATAVALKSGAAANAKYADGVVVFTTTDAGLMFEAALGGQMFNYDGP
jgi:lipid-binding SYLF domain-containing protein